MPKKIDLHVHTKNSFDGKHSAISFCECAQNLGMRAICFTDHCEIDTYEQDGCQELIRHSFFEQSKAKSAFCGKLLVLRGIELGEANHDTALADRIVARYAFDEVIASVHNLRGKQDFYYMEQFEEAEVKPLLTAYFKEILELLEWGNFEILAHLTYPLRYFYAKSGIRVDLSEYKKEIDEILRLCAEKEKALEVNAGGLRQPLAELAPPYPILKRFKELGGKYVTYGSDAHRTEDLGKGMTEAFEAMRAAGFSDLTFFQNRTPLQMSIE